MLLGVSLGKGFHRVNDNWSKTRDATWNTYWNIRVDITRNIAWSNLNTTTWDITWHTPQGMSLGIFLGTSQGKNVYGVNDNWSKTRDITWNTTWDIKVNIARNVHWYVIWLHH